MRISSVCVLEFALKFTSNGLLTYFEHFQVLRVVKTKQVTYSILKHLSDYVQNLEKVGLLEEKEMIHLDDAVQVEELISVSRYLILSVQFFYFVFNLKR